MFTLHDRRAIVCGSTQGIGRAIATLMAEAGATVTLVARNAEGLDRVRADLAASGGRTHHAVTVDFSDWQAVRDTVGAHVREHGPFHILVNNTGGPPAGPAFEAAPEQFADAFSKHLMCNQALAQLVAPGMRDEAYGRIINIISTSVKIPIPNLGVSNTIRGAVASWAKTLANELGPFGITVNNILPGFTATARLDALFQGRASRSGSTVEEVVETVKGSIPARRLGQPEEIAAAALFLASPEAAYVNGINLPVDGGRLGCL